jgi:hypothetical protein
MKTQDYECHVTVLATEVNRGALTNIGRQDGWKTSFVDGDPDLGKGTRFFMTSHYTSQEEAIINTNLIANRINGEGFEVIRRKIEHVVADTRAGNWPS